MVKEDKKSVEIDKDIYLEDDIEEFEDDFDDEEFELDSLDEDEFELDGLDDSEITIG